MLREKLYLDHFFSVDMAHLRTSSFSLQIIVESVSVCNPVPEIWKKTINGWDFKHPNMVAQMIDFTAVVLWR